MDGDANLRKLGFIRLQDHPTRAPRRLGLVLLVLAAACGGALAVAAWDGRGSAERSWEAVLSDLSSQTDPGRIRSDIAALYEKTEAFLRVTGEIAANDHGVLGAHAMEALRDLAENAIVCLKGCEHSGEHLAALAEELR